MLEGEVKVFLRYIFTNDASSLDIKGFLMVSLTLSTVRWLAVTCISIEVGAK